MIIKSITAIALAAGLAASASATNLVSNGGFELNGGPGHIYDNYTYATDWNSNNGYNFVFAPGTADTTGSYTPEFNGYSKFWGSNNGGPNVWPASSPNGGYFMAMDGAFQTQPLQQTLTGLIVGKPVRVSFYWAAAQQHGFSGATTEGFAVSLGNETHTTPIYNNPSHGFSGWFHQSFTFTPTSGTAVLSFLALGTPEGLPPFSLLDGVSATVPEPSTWAMLIAGFGLVGVAARRRRPTVVAA